MRQTMQLAEWRRMKTGKITTADFYAGWDCRFRRRNQLAEWKNIQRSHIPHATSVWVVEKKAYPIFWQGDMSTSRNLSWITDFREYTFRSNFKIQANKRLSFILNTFASYNKSQKGEYGASYQFGIAMVAHKKVYDSESEGGYTQPGGAQCKRAGSV